MSKSKIYQTSVIPDQVLDGHTCRLCDKYLTVGPISIHSDGGFICGRCQQKTNIHQSCLFECDPLTDLNEQINIPYGIFAYLNHLFPCINRYEGCDKLLNFDNISKHELVCKSKKVQCQYCPTYEGTGSQQLNHFRRKHPLNIFSRIYFRFPLNKKFSSNLIKRGENLFFLHVESDNSRRKVQFYLQPTNRHLEDDVEFFCLLKDEETEDVVDQTTLTKRNDDGIYHYLFVKDGQETNNLICECLLRNVARS